MFTGMPNPKSIEDMHSPHTLAYGLLLTFADNFCKQFGPTSGPTNSQAGSRSKLFDTLVVFLKEFCQKRLFWNKTADEMNNYSTCKELNRHTLVQ